MIENRNGKVAELLQKVKPYLAGEPRQTSMDISVILRESVVADPNKYAEIKQLMTQLDAVATVSPPGFRIPLGATKTATNDVAELLYLHKSNIEGGGPQPRREIRPDDPETVTLFKSIKTKGQHDPIDTYPSPLGNGKHRICEGHRRRMVIFDMLMLDGIWALDKQRTEQEAYEDAIILNDKKGLSWMDIAQHGLDMMTKWPGEYPSQEILGKKIGLSHQSISYILLAAKEIEAQKPRLPPEIATRVAELPERTITHIRQAPEELKPKLFTAIIDKDLSVRQTKQLIKEVEATPETSIEEIAQHLKEDAEKQVSKVEREIDKLVEGAVAVVPEPLVQLLYAKAMGEKLTQEKLNNYASFIFKILYDHAVKDGKLEEYLEEAQAEA